MFPKLSSCKRLGIRYPFSANPYEPEYSKIDEFGNSNESEKKILFLHKWHYFVIYSNETAFEFTIYHKERQNFIGLLHLSTIYLHNLIRFNVHSDSTFTVFDAILDV